MRRNRGDCPLYPYFRRPNFPRDLRALGAMSTAFSLRAGGRAPISKARDGTAGSETHDHAFRPPEPAQPAGSGRRGRRDIPCSAGNRARQAGERAGPFSDRPRKTGRCGPGRRGRRAIPCSAGNNRECAAADEDTGNNQGRSGKPGGSGAPPGRPVPPPSGSPRWPTTAGPASPNAVPRPRRGAPRRPPRRARRRGPGRLAGSRSRLPRRSVA